MSNAVDPIERAKEWQKGFAKPDGPLSGIPGPPPRKKRTVSAVQDAPEPAPAAKATAPTEETTPETSKSGGQQLRSVAAEESAGESPATAEREAEPVETAPAPAAPPATPPTRSAGPRTRSGSVRTVSAKTARASRAGEEAGSKAREVLSGLGVAVLELSADVSGSRVHVAVRTPDVEAILANADRIADSLGVTDLDASVAGDMVHIWAEEVTRTVARQRGVWVPVAVRDAVQREADSTRATHTSIVLTAFNRQSGPDGTRLAALFPESASAVAGPMSIPTRKRRTDAGTLVQLWLYLDTAQEAVLDAAVAETGAGSRSALLSKVLATDLGVEGAEPAAGE